MEIYPHIEYSCQKGFLIGGVSATNLAKKYGTPLYVYSEDAIVEKMKEYKTAIDSAAPGGAVIYASKAYLTMAMAALTARQGLYLDVATGGELYIALQAGFPADKIVMHGNNKSSDEIAMAISAGVGRIVVDNLGEIAAIQKIAKQRRKVQGVQLRLTPGIDPDTHKYLATGEITSKFGIAMDGKTPLEAVARIAKSPNLDLLGFHCHIGSQIFDEAPFLAAARIMMEFLADVRDKTGIVAKELNLGGGLGVRYLVNSAGTSLGEKSREDLSPRSSINALCSEAKAGAARFGLPFPRIFVEPGRSLVAAAGVTLYTVGSKKEVPNGETVVAVDGGMSDNPRPALYQAEYSAFPGGPKKKAETFPVRIVGKHCEEGDTIIARTMLPTLFPGDILAVPVSGAYQYSMRSNYNAVPCPAVVHVAGGRAFLVVERQEYKDLVAKERPSPTLAVSVKPGEPGETAGLV